MFNVTPSHFIDRSQAPDGIYFYDITTPLDGLGPEDKVQIRQTTIRPQLVSLTTYQCSYAIFQKTIVPLGCVYGIVFYIEMRRDMQATGLELPRELVVDALYVAAIELAEKLDKVGEDSMDVFTFAKVHGMEYTGATYENELKTLREALVEFGRVASS